MTEYVVRFVYKVFYFYLFPAMVIPLGAYMWRSTNDLKERKYSEVDWSKLDEQFRPDVYGWIYIFIIIIFFYMVMKVVF